MWRPRLKGVKCRAGLKREEAFVAERAAVEKGNRGVGRKRCFGPVHQTASATKGRSGRYSGDVSKREMTRYNHISRPCRVWNDPICLVYRDRVSPLQSRAGPV